jgi:hypothetical protein
MADSHFSNESQLSNKSYYDHGCCVPHIFRLLPLERFFIHHQLHEGKERIFLILYVGLDDRIVLSLMRHEH